MALPVILAGAGIGLSLYGMQQGIEANEANLAFQQEQNRHNQIVAGVLAEDAIDRGERNVRAQRRKIKQTTGAQRAAIASNGFVVDQDSAADVVDDTINWGEVDLAQLRANARMEALQIQAGAVQGNIQASNLAVQTGYANQATVITGASNVLNAGTNYYMMTR